MEDNLELRFHDSPWNDCYEIAFFDRSRNKRYVSEPLVMVEHKDAILITPTARLSRAAMQGLFNELWKAGFRPKDGSGNSSTIDALRYHLEDMRKLVFVTTGSNDERTK